MEGDFHQPGVMRKTDGTSYQTGFGHDILSLTSLLDLDPSTDGIYPTNITLEDVQQEPDREDESSSNRILNIPLDQFAPTATNQATVCQEGHGSFGVKLGPPRSNGGRPVSPPGRSTTCISAKEASVPGSGSVSEVQDSKMLPKPREVMREATPMAVCKRGHQNRVSIQNSKILPRPREVMQGAIDTPMAVSKRGHRSRESTVCVDHKQDRTLKDLRVHRFAVTTPYNRASKRGICADKLGLQTHAGDTGTGQAKRQHFKCAICRAVYKSHELCVNHVLDRHKPVLKINHQLNATSSKDGANTSRGETQRANLNVTPSVRSDSNLASTWNKLGKLSQQKRMVYKRISPAGKTESLLTESVRERYCLNRPTTNQSSSQGGSILPTSKIDRESSYTPRRKNPTALNQTLSGFQMFPQTAGLSLRKNKEGEELIQEKSTDAASAAKVKKAGNLKYLCILCKTHFDSFENCGLHYKSSHGQAVSFSTIPKVETAPCSSVQQKSVPAATALSEESRCQLLQSVQSDATMFMCPICGVTFSSLRECTKHRQTVHHCDGESSATGRESEAQRPSQGEAQHEIGNEEEEAHTSMAQEAAGSLLPEVAGRAESTKKSGTKGPFLRQSCGMIFQSEADFDANHALPSGTPEVLCKPDQTDTVDSLLDQDCGMVIEVETNQDEHLIDFAPSQSLGDDSETTTDATGIEKRPIPEVTWNSMHRLCEGVLDKWDALLEKVSPHEDVHSAAKIQNGQQLCSDSCEAAQQNGQQENVEDGKKEGSEDKVQRMMNYQCSVCSERFFSLGICMSHMKMVHMGEEERDALARDEESCGVYMVSRELSQKDGLRETSKVYSCEGCEAVMYSYQDLSSHIALRHCGRGRLKCEKCRIAARTKEEDGISRVVEDAERLRDKVVGGFKNLKGVAKMQHYRECPVCGNVYSLQSHLRRHLCEHSVFPCQFCDVTFPTFKCLNGHVHVHNCGPLPCRECGQTFYTTSNLYMHLIAHKRMHRCSCETCGKCFTGQLRLRRHMRRVHNNMGTRTKHHFTCEHCGKCYQHQRRYDNHLRRDCAKNPEVSSSVRPPDGFAYMCDVCGISCRNLARLNRHMATHENRFICGLCRSHFQTESQLSLHQTHVHRDTEGSKSKPVAKQLEKIALELDLPSKMLQCDLCGRLLKSQLSLKQHLNTHQEKKHRCGTCGKGFFKAKHLACHQRNTHASGKFACELCERSYTNNRGLLYHMALKHKTDGGSCMVCGKAFQDSIKLRLHQRMHMPKMFPCQICRQSFRSAIGVQMHTSHAHKTVDAGEASENVADTVTLH